MSNLSELPTRKEIELAIATLWRGGGTASLIVDVIRQGEGSLDEARDVAERMARRAASGNSYVTREIVSETLEAVRASASLYKAKEKIHQPSYDPLRCVFSTTLDCPQCSELERKRIRHGPLLPVLDQAHGFHHLRAYNNTGSREEFALAKNPRECECGYDPTGDEAVGGDLAPRDAAAARPAGLQSSPASPPEET